MKLLSAVAKATTIVAMTIAFSTTPSIAYSSDEESFALVTAEERTDVLNLFKLDAPVVPLILPATLTERQAQLITAAHRQAEEDKLKDPELLPGVLMQESHAGNNPVYKKALNRCYGIFQIKIGTALHVLREYPELIAKYNVDMREAALKKQLINDDAFNTAVASKYMLILMKYGYQSVRELALAYNQGMAGAKKFNPKTFVYSNGVAKYVSFLYPAR